MVKRDKKLQVFLSAEELEALKERADSEGLTASAYVRKLILSVGFSQAITDGKTHYAIIENQSPTFMVRGGRAMRVRVDEDLRDSYKDTEIEE